MKKELKERWIAALRSGDYIQSQGCLQDQHGWCCLGVLCNIVDGTKWVELDKPYESTIQELEYDFGSVSVNDMPPSEWLENLGLPYNAAMHLADLNDNGVSFAKIAKYIEDYVHEND